MAFQDLPDESRIWVYGFKKILTPDEYNFVRTRLEQFKKEWMYHGNSVTGDYEIVENRFVIIATNDAISGCSIDSSVAVFKEFKQNAGLDALDQSLVFYRADKETKAVNRAEFQKLADDGKINNETRVFNLLINHLGAYKQGHFETKFEKSWHCKVFKLAEGVSS